MKVNVLGTDYEVVRQTEAQNEKLETANGLCEPFSQKLIICDFTIDKDTVENPEAYKEKVLRHELVHAFMFESGLDVHCKWNTEEMVDWVAIQLPKIIDAYEKSKSILKED